MSDRPTSKTDTSQVAFNFVLCLLSIAIIAGFPEWYIDVILSIVLLIFATNLGRAICEVNDER